METNIKKQQTIRILKTFKNLFVKELFRKKKTFERQIVQETLENSEKEATYLNGKRYRLVKKIGKRLFGTVYLVEDAKDYR